MRYPQKRTAAKRRPLKTELLINCTNNSKKIINSKTTKRMSQGKQHHFNLLNPPQNAKGKPQNLPFSATHNK